MTDYLTSTLSEPRRVREQEQDRSMTIWVGVAEESRYDHRVVGSCSYWEMAAANYRNMAEPLYLRLALTGHSDSDISRIFSRGGDPDSSPRPMSSDSGLPHVSKGMVFYGNISDLEAALDELEAIAEAAREDDCLEPTQTAIDNADLLLKTLYDISSRRYDIYPMSGGEIVIDGGSRGRRIGVFCYPDGRVLYVGWVDGVRQKVSKHGVANLPRIFLKKALSQLDAFEQHEQQSP